MTQTPDAPVELVTRRLRLRRARPDDLADLHAILSHPDAMRFWSSLPHTDLEQSRAWLANMIDAPPGESDDFIVEMDGRAIGKAGFWRLPAIGYILHPDYWGQGLATEALRAAIDHVFATYPIPIVVADVDPDNAASLALLAKLGFVETHRAQRTWQIGDNWYDSVFLALRRPAA
ncbi:MAG TPA: GNAT family N-acetyltransferase [Phenylobacterium sp.]|uniref:GNAT family N-acetyltransferase n=1 Tax=Phenylobacterium sp. TaxID=1871053 RepID=UPI002D2A2EBD|nr:GNAT family N-acetyltransferase [Phenylobacterium sp.]HZZ67057.1 GNAT family N-acetyltransferase [Phenylobacterium sp.]